MHAIKWILQLVVIVSYMSLGIIGACIGYVGLTEILSPNHSMVIDSHVFGLFALSYLFYALLIVYNKSRLVFNVSRPDKNV